MVGLTAADDHGAHGHPPTGFHLRSPRPFCQAPAAMTTLRLSGLPRKELRPFDGPRLTDEAKIAVSDLPVGAARGAGRMRHRHYKQPIRGGASTPASARIGEWEGGSNACDLRSPVYPKQMVVFLVRSRVVCVWRCCGQKSFRRRRRSADKLLHAKDRSAETRQILR